MQYRDLFKNLCTAPTVIARGHTTKELCNVQLDPECDLYAAPGRNLTDPSTKEGNYLLHELVWYLNGDSNVKYIAENGGKFWKSIADERGDIHSNYGALTLFYDRHFGFSPVQFVIGELRRDLNSRRAVILYNKPEFCYGLNKDFVCTQVQQFMHRGGKLNSTVYIRSSDAIRGLSFDIPWWKFLQSVIANTLGVSTGALTVFLGSAHVYEEHFALAAAMAETVSHWQLYAMDTTAKFDDIAPEVNAEGIITGSKNWTVPKLQQFIKFRVCNGSAHL
jgi:thymidylate synthase